MRREKSKATLTAITPVLPSEAAQPGTAMRQAWVTAQGKGDSFILRLDSGEMRNAKRAAACLLQPEPGDSVLAFTPAGGRTYILSILEKSSRKHRIRLEGDTELDTGKGRLDIKAAQLGLKADSSLELEAPSLALRGVHATMNFLQTRLYSLDLELCARQATGVFDSLRTRARSLVQELTDSLRRVENVETLEAGHLRERIRHTRHSLAGTIIAKARKRLKLDGKRIDLG